MTVNTAKTCSAFLRFFAASMAVSLLSRAADAPKPNIIFIMCDDLGYGELGCYGQDKIQTPHLDRMAGEGLLLTQYYAGTSVCAPSRCSLMTGKDIGHCYIRGNKEYTTGQEPLPSETVTVAEKLKDAGYTTALIGKWGLGYPGSDGEPNNQGFDLFFGYNDQKRAHHYYPGWIWRNHEKIPLGPAGTTSGYSHYALTREARTFIKKHKDGPFFLELAYTIPHARLEIPADDPNYLQYQQKDWPEKMKVHAGMISLMDQDVGGILDLLNQLNIARNTLVVFTSDNGPHGEDGADPSFFNSSGPLRGIKRDMYEGGVRVPFIARWPGVIFPGQKSDHIAAHWDFMPTACELAGIAAPTDIDGISYAPLLKGNSARQKEHSSVYFELHWPDRRGLRQGDWVALQQRTTAMDPDVDQIQLYNLKTDLSQHHELSERYPEKLEELKNELRDASEPSDIFKYGTPFPKVMQSPPTGPAPLPLVELPHLDAEGQLRVVNINLGRKFLKSLPGVIGIDEPFWNCVETTCSVSNLKDEQGRETPLVFDFDDDELIRFAADKHPEFFFHSYAFLNGQGKPGPQGEAGFAISGLDPDQSYNIYCYATWAYITAGSEFRFSGDGGAKWSAWKLADGNPSEITAPFADGHSYVAFRALTPDLEGTIRGEWKTTLQGGSTAYRGMFNALQIEEISF